MASCVTACFLMSFVVADIVRAAVEPDRTLPSVGSLVPAANGRVTAFRDFGTRQLVINIQDLHCHPEVQRNISATLASLDRAYQLKTVYVEGGYGAVDTSWLCSIKDEAFKREALNELVDNGTLTGPEQYSVIADRPALLRGIENETVHRQNIVRLGKILERQGSYDKIVRDMERGLRLAVDRYLGAENRKLSRLAADYRRGAVTAEKFYRLLGKRLEQAEREPELYPGLAGTRLSDYPSITAYLEVTDLQRKVSVKRATRQLQSCLAELKMRLPYASYSELIDQTGNFRDLDTLYARLSVLAAEPACGAIIATYPDLSYFLSYIEKSRAINALTLIDEERRLVEEVRAASVADSAEIDVCFLDEFMPVFEDYLRNRVTAEDCAYLAGKLTRFRAMWARYVAGSSLADLDADLALLDEFYRANTERNTIFARNIPLLSGREAAVPSQNEEREAVVIVTGGFHSDAIRSLCESRKVSYCVITPNITGGDTEATARYARLAAEQARLLTNMLALGLASQTSSSHLFSLLMSVAAKRLGAQSFSRSAIETLVTEMNTHTAAGARLASMTEADALIHFPDGRQLRVVNRKGTMMLDDTAFPLRQAQTSEITQSSPLSSQTLFDVLDALYHGSSIAGIRSGLDSAVIASLEALVRHGFMEGKGLAYDVASHHDILARLPAIEQEVLSDLPAAVQKAIVARYGNINTHASRRALSRWLEILIAIDLLSPLIGVPSADETMQPGGDLRTRIVTAYKTVYEKSRAANWGADAPIAYDPDTIRSRKLGKSLLTLHPTYKAEKGKSKSPALARVRSEFPNLNYTREPYRVMIEDVFGDGRYTMHVNPFPRLKNAFLVTTSQWQPQRMNKEHINTAFTLYEMLEDQGCKVYFHRDRTLRNHLHMHVYLEHCPLEGTQEAYELVRQLNNGVRVGYYRDFPASSLILVSPRKDDIIETGSQWINALDALGVPYKINFRKDRQNNYRIEVYPEKSTVTLKGNFATTFPGHLSTWDEARFASATEKYLVEEYACLSLEQEKVNRIIDQLLPLPIVREPVVFTMSPSAAATVRPDINAATAQILGRLSGTVAADVRAKDPLGFAARRRKAFLNILFRCFQEPAIYDAFVRIHEFRGYLDAQAGVERILELAPYAADDIKNERWKFVNALRARMQRMVRELSRTGELDTEQVRALELYISNVDDGTLQDLLSHRMITDVLNVAVSPAADPARDAAKTAAERLGMAETYRDLEGALDADEIFLLCFQRLINGRSLPVELDGRIPLGATMYELQQMRTRLLMGAGIPYPVDGKITIEWLRHSEQQLEDWMDRAIVSKGADALWRGDDYLYHTIWFYRQRKNLVKDHFQVNPSGSAISPAAVLAVRQNRAALLKYLSAEEQLEAISAQAAKAGSGRAQIALALADTPAKIKASLDRHHAVLMGKGVTATFEFTLAGPDVAGLAALSALLRSPENAYLREMVAGIAISADADPRSMPAALKILSDYNLWALAHDARPLAIAWHTGALVTGLSIESAQRRVKEAVDVTNSLEGLRKTRVSYVQPLSLGLDFELMAAAVRKESVREHIASLKSDIALIRSGVQLKSATLAGLRLRLAFWSLAGLFAPGFHIPMRYDEKKVEDLKIRSAAILDSIIRQGGSIEVSPTVDIATCPFIRSMADHPYFRLKQHQYKTTLSGLTGPSQSTEAAVASSPALTVRITAIDQGIFATSIRDEYVHLAKIMRIKPDKIEELMSGVGYHDTQSGVSAQSSADVASLYTSTQGFWTHIPVIGGLLNGLMMRWHEGLHWAADLGRGRIDVVRGEYQASKESAFVALAAPLGSVVIGAAFMAVGYAGLDRIPAVVAALLMTGGILSLTDGLLNLFSSDPRSDRHRAGKPGMVYASSSYDEHQPAQVEKNRELKRARQIIIDHLLMIQREGRLSTTIATAAYWKDVFLRAGHSELFAVAQQDLRHALEEGLRPYNQGRSLSAEEFAKLALGALERLDVSAEVTPQDNEGYREFSQYIDMLKNHQAGFRWDIAGHDAAQQLGFGEGFASLYDMLVREVKRRQGRISIYDVVAMAEQVGKPSQEGSASSGKMLAPQAIIAEAAALLAKAKSEQQIDDCVALLERKVREGLGTNAFTDKEILPTIDDFVTHQLIPRGYLVEQSPIGLRDERFLVVYRILRCDECTVDNETIKVYYVAQTTKYGDDLLRRNNGWSSLFNDYVVVFTEGIEQDDVGIEKTLYRVPPRLTGGQESASVSRIYQKALIAAFKMYDKKQRIAICEAGTALHEIEHERRRRMLHLQEGDVVYSGVDEQLAELASIIDGEPKHIIAHLIELASGRVSFAWILLTRLAGEYKNIINALHSNDPEQVSQYILADTRLRQTIFDKIEKLVAQPDTILQVQARHVYDDVVEEWRAAYRAQLKPGYRTSTKNFWGHVPVVGKILSGLMMRWHEGLHWAADLGRGKIDFAKWNYQASKNSAFIALAAPMGCILIGALCAAAGFVGFERIPSVAAALLVVGGILSITDGLVNLFSSDPSSDINQVLTGKLGRSYQSSSFSGKTRFTGLVALIVLTVALMFTATGDAPGSFIAPVAPAAITREAPLRTPGIIDQLLTKEETGKKTESTAKPTSLPTQKPESTPTPALTQSHPKPSTTKTPVPRSVATPAPALSFNDMISELARLNRLPGSSDHASAALKGKLKRLAADMVEARRWFVTEGAEPQYNFNNFDTIDEVVIEHTPLHAKDELEIEFNYSVSFIETKQVVLHRIPDANGAVHIKVSDIGIPQEYLHTVQIVFIRPDDENMKVGGILKDGMILPRTLPFVQQWIAEGKSAWNIALRVAFQKERLATYLPVKFYRDHPKEQRSVSGVLLITLGNYLPAVLALSVSLLSGGSPLRALGAAAVGLATGIVSGGLVHAFRDLPVIRWMKNDAEQYLQNVVMHVTASNDPSERARFVNDASVAHLWCCAKPAQLQNLTPTKLQVSINGIQCYVGSVAENGVLAYYVDLAMAGVAPENIKDGLILAAGQIMAQIAGKDVAVSRRSNDALPGTSDVAVMAHGVDAEAVRAALAENSINRIPVFDVTEITAEPPAVINAEIGRRMSDEKALTSALLENKIMKMDVDSVGEFIRNLKVFNAAGNGQMMIDWAVIASLAPEKLKELIREAKGRGVLIHVHYAAAGEGAVAEIERISNLGFAGVSLDLSSMNNADAGALLKKLDAVNVIAVAGATSKVPLKLVDLSDPASMRAIADNDVLDIVIPAGTPLATVRATLKGLPLGHTMIFHSADIKTLMESSHDILDRKIVAAFYALLVATGVREVRTNTEARRLAYHWAGADLPWSADDIQLRSLSAGDLAGIAGTSAWRERAEKLTGTMRTEFLSALVERVLIGRTVSVKSKQCADEYRKGKFTFPDRRQESVLGKMLLQRFLMSPEAAVQETTAAAVLKKELKAGDTPAALRLAGEGKTGALSVAIDMMIVDLLADYNLRRFFKGRLGTLNVMNCRKILGAA